MIAKIKRSLWMGIALIASVGVVMALATTSSIANADKPGTLQPVWCHLTGNDWKAQLGAAPSGDRHVAFPLMGDFGLGTTSSGQTLEHDRSSKLDAACGEQAIATAHVSTNPATCSTAEQLVWGGTENATFNSAISTPNGTFGPGSYSVTADAFTGYHFANNMSTETFAGTLAGKLPAQNTNPEGRCYTLFRTAMASVRTIPATCTSAEQLVWGPTENATLSGTPSGTFGPGAYFVIALASPDYLFSNGDAVQFFGHTLAGKIPSQSTNPYAPCYVQPALKDATVALSVTEPTCDAAAMLQYNGTHVTFTGTASGTTGATTSSYDVTATVVAGHLFADGTTTKSYTGTLAGHLTGLQCGEEQPTVATASVTILPATCKAGEMLTYTNVQNATASGTANGTAGPGAYDVTFTANEGAAFVNGETTVEQLHFTGTLKGMLTDPSCEQGSVLGSTTTTPGQATPPAASVAAPATLPETAGEAGNAVIVGGSLLAVIAAAVGIRRLVARGL